jgi:hypothetical protein
MRKFFSWFLGSAIFGVAIACVLGGAFSFYLAMPRVYEEHPSGRCVWAEDGEGKKIPCKVARSGPHEIVYVAPQRMRDQNLESR